MTDTAPSAPPPPAAAPAAPEPRKRVLWAVVAAVVAVFAVGLVLYAWRLPPFTGHVQRTDNAYVRGQVTIISPQVSGYVTAVPVQDFQRVQQGQLLAQVDDRTYRQSWNRPRPPCTPQRRPCPTRPKARRPRAEPWPSNAPRSPPPRPP